MIFRGELSTGGKQHAARNSYKSSAYCTWHLLIMVHGYKCWGWVHSFGGNFLSEYWPLQQRHPYLQGGTCLQGSTNLRGNTVTGFTYYPYYPYSY